MRRFLLLIITAMMTISSMAIGDGSGKDKANAIDFNWMDGNLHETTETLWYNVDLSPMDDAKYLVLYVTNLADEVANLKMGVSAMGMTLEGLDTVIAVGGHFRFELPMEMVNSVLGDLGLSSFLGDAIDLDHVALSLQSDQKVYLAAKVYETTKEYLQEEVINNSEVIDWNSGVVLEPLMTKWYEIDIASLKQNKQHLYISFKSYAKETAVILTSLLINDSIVTLPVPVKAGFDFGQTIDYQLLAKLPVNNIRVGVTSTAKVEIATSVRSAIAADPTPCLNAINPEHGVEYTHKAGSSQWYKVSLDLLKSKAAYSSIYLENKSGKTAHVTIGAVTDCQYTTGSTITLPIPAGLNIGALAPNLLGNIIEQLVRFEKVYNRVDAADIYLQIKSDQDVSFGLDVVNATTNPCLREDLVTFDWNKGAKIQAGTPVWYDVDLTTIKNSGKHVKLTFTNHTDSLVWAATVVSVDCPAKLTMPLIVPVPARTCVDKFIDYHYFAVPNVDNIYVGVVADGVLEMAATTYDAVITPSADCLNAVEVTSNFSYTQKAGSQWYKVPMGLLNDGGHAGKFSFRNLGAETVTITAGVTVGCEYAIPTYGKVKMPKELAFSLAVPTSILAKARKFIDADITEFYMQLTSDQDILVALNMDASDLKACSSAVPFDWNDWEKNGLLVQANQDIWYEVNLRYPWEKMKKGEDLILSITNNNNVSVDFEAAVSPTCPVVFALETYATIPANVTAQQAIEFSKLAEFLKQFDRQLYNDETALIIEKYNAYVVLNKIDAKLGKYGKYFPLTKLQNILDEYGHLVAYAELKDLIDNREKYLSKAELKSRLEQAKAMFKEETQEHLSMEQAIQIIERLDDYIPYVEAETILKNYDQILPYAGGAVALLKMCEKYIPTDEIKQIVVKAKNAIPMDKIHALFDKIEARLPRDLNCYLRVKTTGDIIVEPDTVVPAPDGCEDAIEYVWGTDVVVNEEAWYKVSIADVRNNDCSITLTVTNNSADSVKADLSLYENCDDDQAFLTMKNVGIAPNTTRSKTISASELPGDIDVLYLYVQPYGEMTINLSTDCPVFKYEYATVASYACGTEVLTWKDTVHVNKYLDSVYTYVVTPFGAPIQMTQAILDTIAGATPVLTPGTTPDMTASAEAIKAFYLAQDTEALADVVKVEWTATAIACGATTHTMTLTIEDVCGNVQTADYTFDVITPALQVIDTTVTICASELPYTWKGTTYPTAGTHTTTISNVYGCDSAQLTLTINLYPAIPKTKVVEQICANAVPFVWNGKSYYDSAKDTVVLVSNVNGCDSVVILNLTVLPEIVSYDTVTVCHGEKYYWIEAENLECKRNGDYQYTFTSVEGCDSVANLHVKWLPKTSNTKTVAEYVCDGTEYVDPITNEKHIISSLIPSTQTWNDTVAVSQCEDSVYTYVITPIVAPEVMTDATLASIAVAPVLTQGALPNVNGTVEAIKMYYAGKDSESIADVDSIYWTEASLNTVVPCGATTHTMTLVVEAGCDNKITTTHTFEVLPVIGTTETIVECDSYTWNGQTYTTSGDYTFTGQTVAGCDSIATLHLTINKSVQVEETATACDSYTWNGQTYTTSGDYTFTGQTAAGCDSVAILHLTINNSVQVEETATACDSYTWNGQTYTTSGDYTFTGQTAAGCDSVAILHLTINNSVQVEETATACDSYTWDVDGKTYTTSGDYTFTGQTATGCDSIVTLHLTINKSVYTEDIQEACDSYDWNGMTLTANGIYTHTLQTAAGCDSIVTLRLTINKSFYKEVSATACDSYTWDVDGKTYTTSGDYTFNGKTAAGCDSTHVLHLTINNSVQVEETATACDSYTWSVDGKTYTTSGDYTFTGQTAAGCDSIVTLHLTINKSVQVEETATACDSYTWAVDGKTYTTSGDYTFNGQTAAGCDSIVTLHLTINKSFYKEETAAACVSYTWAVDGKTYTTSGDYTFTGQTAAGCDSTYVLHLTILPDVVYEPTETDYFCPGSTYDWRGYTFNAPGTYTHTIQNALGCDSIIYTLELLQYVNTLPVITADDIVAVCGNAIDVTLADAIIKAHIASETLYAPNADVKWYVLSGNTYEELTNTAIDGTVTEVTLKYTVTTDCGVVESDPIVVTVVPNSPEHDDTLADVPAYNKYGGRLLTVDVKYIRETFGLEVTEDEVTWYLENGDNDIEQGKGYYLTTEDGTPLPAGQYYALINYQGKSNVECDIILQTITLVVETQVGPMLLPTVAKPDELIRVLNLDSDATSTITIYSSTGQQLDSFQVKDAKETSFNAAHVAGYYIVEVQTESDKVSLRYVVK